MCYATSKAVALLYASSARKEDMTKLYPLTAAIGFWILVILKVLNRKKSKKVEVSQPVEEDYGTIVAPTV